ncbi:hypothetical protein M9H77_23371 [Catharanthus roseus]|uniref:Uncharacterized protein n=1 Tax=Catharanthus roseus TaxID=4058 RepID=A0ACC0AST8_CATRO|nr:hypothetical protein M9H77_23371 [Catharanthus roseus]
MELLKSILHLRLEYIYRDSGLGIGLVFLIICGVIGLVVIIIILNWMLGRCPSVAPSEFQSVSSSMVFLLESMVILFPVVWNPKNGRQTFPIINDPNLFNSRDNYLVIHVCFVGHITIKFSDTIGVILARDVKNGNPSQPFKKSFKLKVSDGRLIERLFNNNFEQRPVGNPLTGYHRKMLWKGKNISYGAERGPFNMSLFGLGREGYSFLRSHRWSKNKQRI